MLQVAVLLEKLNCRPTFYEDFCMEVDLMHCFWLICFTVTCKMLVIPKCVMLKKRKHVPAGIQTQDLLNTSQTLLPTEPLGLWHRSGGYMAYIPIDTDRFTDRDIPRP